MEHLLALLAAQNVQSVLVNQHAVVGARPGGLATKQLLQLLQRVPDAVSVKMGFITRSIHLKVRREKVEEKGPLQNNAHRMVDLPEHLVDVTQSVHVGSKQTLNLRHIGAAVPFLCFVEEKTTKHGKYTSTNWRKQCDIC